MVNKTVQKVTKQIASRSERSRAQYEGRMAVERQQGSSRATLPCGNLAHGLAACTAEGKALLAREGTKNIGLISAYNDLLSAHQPYETYPEQIKTYAASHGVSCQFAGGVPAMCDGITQGMPGMELSLLSRDVIAMATAIALSHRLFDGVMLLGICDKIVPGLLIGALSFGHLPAIFVPSGPMPSGIGNREKARARQQFAKGEITEADLLKVESAAYHSPGTCTFYGTANSNQMLMEIMGLQLPGSAFVPPSDPVRHRLTDLATHTLIERMTTAIIPLGQIVDAKALVNGLVGLLATGGSTNHCLHLIAIARAAGYKILLEDMATLSEVVPLLARVYPNGEGDINDFHAAGGMPFLISQLLLGKLLHEDVYTVMGQGLAAYTRQPVLVDGDIRYQPSAKKTRKPDVLTAFNHPFTETGGLCLLEGNLGRSVIKSSSVLPERYLVRAGAKVFDSQEAFKKAFDEGRLACDFIAVVRYQGPKANGMPELHKLMTYLGALQDQGFQVALVTDGRLSGASGKVPAAIHLTPEAADGGWIGRIQEGDMITLDIRNNRLQLEVSEDVLAARPLGKVDLSANDSGTGRELFHPLRQILGRADEGASIFWPD